jgi:hypothetical protein
MQSESTPTDDSQENLESLFSILTNRQNEAARELMMDSDAAGSSSSSTSKSLAELVKASLDKFRIDSQKISVKEQVFPDAFSTKEAEQIYMSKVKKYYEELAHALKGVTFISLSGVIGAGKDTFGDIIENLLKSKGSHLHYRRMSYAEPLKDTNSTVFVLDRDRLRNRSPADRDWVSSIDSDDALFWSTTLLSSRYTNSDYPSFHDEEIKRIYTMNDSDLEKACQDVVFRKCFSKGTQQKSTSATLSALAGSTADVSTILRSSTATSQTDDNEEDMDLGVEGVMKKIKDVREEVCAAMDFMAPSSRFIRDISHPSVDILPNLFPVTPRSLMEFIGTDVFRSVVCKDVWVLSGIRKLIKEIALVKKQGDHKPWVILMTDVRFRNEATLPAKFGAKVIYIYVYRELAMNALDVYKELDAYIAGEIDFINKRNKGVPDQYAYPRSVPSQQSCEDFVNNWVYKHNRQPENASKQQPKPPLIKWIPILLAHYMREKYSSKFYEFNKKNQMDVIYYRIHNKEMKPHDVERMAHLVQIFNALLEKHGIIPPLGLDSSME